MRGFKNFKGSDARCPSIHFLFYDKVIVLCVVDLTVELTDLATEITKYANLRTHIRKNKQDNKLLFQIIGQIHGAMLLNIDLFTLSCILYIYPVVLTVMCISSLNSTISNHIASDSPSRRTK